MFHPPVRWLGGRIGLQKRHEAQEGDQAPAICFEAPVSCAGSLNKSDTSLLQKRGLALPGSIGMPARLDQRPLGWSIAPAVLMAVTVLSDALRNPTRRGPIDGEFGTIPEAEAQSRPQHGFDAEPMPPAHVPNAAIPAIQSEVIHLWHVGWPSVFHVTEAAAAPLEMGLTHGRARRESTVDRLLPKSEQVGCRDGKHRGCKESGEEDTHNQSTKYLPSHLNVERALPGRLLGSPTAAGRVAYKRRDEGVNLAGSKVRR
jgi:hypothetical protein